MQVLKNFFLFDSTDFSKQIKFPSMTFKEEIFEKEYTHYKFEKKNIIVFLGITIYFNIFLVGIRSIQAFFSVNLDLRSVKVSLFTSLSYMVLCNLPLILEGIIHFIDKIRILRGFSINIFPFIGILIYSNEYCNSIYFTATPMFITATVIYLPIAFITALIYSVNWICGSIQIFCYNFIIIFGIAIMPGNTILDKPWFILMMISSALSSIITLYYYEYFQRKCIFLKIVAEKQKENFEKVLYFLPAPLIVSITGKAVYANEAFLTIPTEPREVNSLYVNHQDPQSIHILPSIKEFENFDNEIESKMKIIKLSDSETTLLSKVKSDDNFDSSDFYIKKEENVIIKHFEISSKPIPFPSYKSNVYFFKDVTSCDEISKLEIQNYKNWLHFASVTHDFRTPIGIILGNAELLSDQVKSLEKRLYISNISNAGQLLYLLVQDLLDYTQIKSNKISICPADFDLRIELEEFLKLFYDRFKDKHLFLELEFSQEFVNLIHNDLNRIKLVLMNLISNSYKFTKKGGVTVLVEDLREIDLISISVKDTGIGIAPTFIGKLFKEYSKIDSPSSIPNSGVGLGLYKCKQLVKHLGGEISFNSNENFGSIFTFTFKKYLNINMPEIIIPSSNQFRINDPINNSSKENKNNYEQDSPDSDRIRFLPRQSKLKMCECSKILIVDDDCQIRRILNHYAYKCNLSCDEAESGKKALELVKKKMASTCCKSYQKILMDYLLIDMNGMEVAKRVKQELMIFPNNLKIIILTGVMNKIPESDYDKNNPPFDRIENKPILLHKFREIVDDNSILRIN